MNLICNVTVNRFSVRVSALSPLKGTGSDYTMGMMDLFLKGYDAANYSNCNESRKVYLKFPSSYYLWLKCPVRYHTTIAGIVRSNNLFLNPHNSSSD